MPSGGARAYSLERRDDAAKREYWACLALRECSGLGLRRVSSLMSHFGSAYGAVQALDSWPEAGVPSSCATRFKKEEWRPTARLEWAAAGACPCGIVFRGDEEYPVWLRSIADAPPFLYFFGDISLMRNLAVAVVGMRACSDEGLRSAATIARGLSKAGVTVVSGMAMGIDRAAHLAGLEGPGGSIGVLGAGITVVYPKANKDLYELMHEKGLLLSELPPGREGTGKCFPVRNRIISGLSRAIVVVEAAMRSGSLNTAGHALEQNRELMAVPGATSAASAKGCQELVRRGAKPVFRADDVLQEVIPFLAEHVRKGLLARDLERFQKRPDKPAATVPEDSGPLAEGILPWRAPLRKSAPLDGKNNTADIHVPIDAVSDSPVTESPNAASLGLTGLEARVYDLVRREPSHVDDICRTLRQNAAAVSAVGALLEVRGILVRRPGMIYALK